jgi:hypothetical protein
MCHVPKTNLKCLREEHHFHEISEISRLSLSYLCNSWTYSTEYKPLRSSAYK